MTVSTVRFHVDFDPTRSSIGCWTSRTACNAEVIMRNKTATAMAVATMTVVAMCAQAAQTNEPDPYATMAPLERYLIAEQEKEIALARTAAPASISGDAAIYVLTRHGYERAIDRKS